MTGLYFVCVCSPDQSPDVIADYIDELGAGRSLPIQTVAYDCNNHQTTVRSVLFSVKNLIFRLKFSFLLARIYILHYYIYSTTCASVFMDNNHSLFTTGSPSENCRQFWRPFPLLCLNKWGNTYDNSISHFLYYFLILCI